MMKRIHLIVSGLLVLSVGVSCLRDMNPLSPDASIIRAMFGKANYIFYSDSISNHMIRASMSGSASVVVNTNQFFGIFALVEKAFSWDEKYIYLRGQKVGDTYSNIYRANVDGTGMTKIVSKPVSAEVYLVAGLANKKFLAKETAAATSLNTYVIYGEDGARGDVVFEQSSTAVTITGVRPSLDGRSIFAHHYVGAGTVTNSWKKYSIKERTVHDVLFVVTNAPYYYDMISPEGDHIYKVDVKSATEYSLKKVAASGGGLAEFGTMTIAAGESIMFFYAPYKCITAFVMNATTYKVYMVSETGAATLLTTLTAADYLPAPTAKCFMATDCFGKYYATSTTNMYSPGIVSPMIP